jgi:hypothetical protein
LKRQFSQVEGDSDLQGFFKLVPIPNHNAPRKKLAMVKHEKSEKVGKKFHFV